MNENVKQIIESGNTSLGIEFGSTRIKAVLIDDDNHVLAQGSSQWENRFENNVLERAAKIRDSGFTPISEASHMDANTNRNKQVYDILQDWLRRYEQNCKYIEVVGI